MKRIGCNRLSLIALKLHAEVIKLTPVNLIEFCLQDEFTYSTPPTIIELQRSVIPELSTDVSSQTTTRHDPHLSTGLLQFLGCS